MKTKKVVTRLASIIIAVILVAILLTQINLGDITTALTSIDPIYIIIGFIFYLCSYIFRALRFYILLNKQISVKDLFSIVCLHNMMNNILPAKMGELSYIYLVNKIHTKSTGEGIATLMVARVFDLITVSLLFLVAAISVKNLTLTTYNALAIFGVFLALVVLILLNLVYFGAKFMNTARKIIPRIGIGHNKVISYLLVKGDETVLSLEVIKSKRLIGWTWILSMLVWASLYIVNYALINAMGIKASFESIMFASTFPVFTTILPIHALGGFGTIESGWTIGFMAIGIPKEIAITLGFSLHILTYMYFIILGLYGAWKLKLKGIC